MSGQAYSQVENRANPMENEHVSNLLREHVLERDRMEFSTGDTLDVKAGLLLVMLTFLAVQASDLFQGQFNHSEKVAEYISVFAMTVGGILAIAQLYPRDYGVRSSPKKYADWVTEVEKHYQSEPSPGHKASEYISQMEISQAIQRVEQNRAINRKKSQIMIVCFVCVAVAFLANLAVLMLKHLF